MLECAIEVDGTVVSVDDNNVVETNLFIGCANGNNVTCINANSNFSQPTACNIGSIVQSLIFGRSSNPQHPP